MLVVKHNSSESAISVEGVVLADSQDSFDDFDVYTEAVDKMDTKVIVISTLEVMSGVFGGIQTIMLFSVGFYEEPLIYANSFDHIQGNHWDSGSLITCSRMGSMATRTLGMENCYGC